MFKYSLFAITLATLTFSPPTIATDSIYLNIDKVLTDDDTQPWQTLSPSGITNIEDGSSVKIDASQLSASSKLGQGLYGIASVMTNPPFDVSIGKNVTIDLTASAYSQPFVWAYALYIQNGVKEATVGENLNIKVTGANKSTSANIAVSGGVKLTLNGATLLNESEPPVGYGRRLTILATGGTVKGNRAIYTLKGDIFAQNGGIVTLDLAKSSSMFGDIYIYPTTDTLVKLDMQGSTLTGRTYFKSNNFTNGGIKLLMSENSRWDMTGPSHVTQLSFSGATSNVNFLGKDSGNNNAYTTLTVDELSGTGGIFNMRTDLGAAGNIDPAAPDYDANHGAGIYGDLLIVNNADDSKLEGLHTIKVANNGAANTDGDHILTIIQTNKDTADQHFNLAHQVELGGYLYDLKAVEGQTNHLALQSTGKVSPPGEGGIHISGAEYMMGMIETQTLMKRMGDLRNTAQEGGNLWVRTYGGDTESRARGKVDSFDLKHYGIQMGFDRKIDQEHATQYAGLFVGYTRGDLDYARGGSGDMDSYSLGAYFTHMADNDWYIDTLLKLSWYDSDYTMHDTAGTRVHASNIGDDAESFSIEVGKRHFFDRNAREGWYLEPQAQAIFSHFGGNSFTASNGLHVKTNNFDSQILRVGTHLGYEIKKGENPWNAYAKLYFLKELDGRIPYRLNNGPKELNSYQDNWWVYGVGVTAKLNDQHNLYADFERSTGGRMQQKWGINIGYRYSW